MPTAHEVRLTSFSFPDELDENKQDFRLQVDLRFREASGGEFGMTTVILPGLGLYWECSAKERSQLTAKPRPDRIYARKENGDSSVAIDRVGTWDTVFRIRSTELYEMRVTVFDVDHKSWWSKVGDVLRDIRSFLVSLPVAVSKVQVGEVALKSVSEDAVSSIGRRLAGHKNRVLFVGSAAYSANKKEPNWTIAGSGVGGEYTLEFIANEMA